jgi:p-aminobenzoyl-glutamate transporter AbgT
MKELLPVFISLIVVLVIVVLISKKFNLSTRYERKPRELNTWSSLDHGVDPTEEDGK